MRQGNGGKRGTKEKVEEQHGERGKEDEKSQGREGCV